MTWNMGDGFDFWNGTTDPTLGAGPATWAAFSLALTSTTRFSVGQGVQFNYSGIATTQVMPNNDPVHHLVFAFRRGTGSTSACYGCFTFYDGTAAQCTVSLHADGSIRLYSGAGTGAASGAGTVPGGTLLATASGLIGSAAVWYGIEIEVKIDGAAGYMNIRMNGNPVNDYSSAQTLNTRNGSANAYANKLSVFDQGGGYNLGNTAATWGMMDDFLWFTTAGAAPNAWVGDIRCVQQMPSSDAQTQLVPFPATVTYGWTATNSNTGSIAAGSFKTSKLQTITGYGYATAVSVYFSANYTGKFRVGLYGTSGTSPSTLLAQSAEVTAGAVNSAFTVVPLTTTVRVTPNMTFFVGILVDTAATLQEDTAGANNVYIAGQTYAAGLPSPNTASPTTNFGMIANVIVQPDCALEVNNLIEDGDTTYVAGTTAGLNDFYNMAALTSTPASIIGIQTKMLMRKDDSGAKQARVQVKSGATTVNGPTVALSTSYQYTSRVDTVDPNTSAAWLASAITSLQIGPYVVA